MATSASKPCRDHAKKLEEEILAEGRLKSSAQAGTSNGKAGAYESDEDMPRHRQSRGEGRTRDSRSPSPVRDRSRDERRKRKRYSRSRSLDRDRWASDLRATLWKLDGWLFHEGARLVRTSCTMYQQRIGSPVYVGKCLLANLDWG